MEPGCARTLVELRQSPAIKHQMPPVTLNAPLLRALIVGWLVAVSTLHYLQFKPVLAAVLSEALEIMP